MMDSSKDFKYAFAALMQLEYDDRGLDTSVCTGPAGQFCPEDGDAVIDFCKCYLMPES